MDCPYAYQKASSSVLAWLTFCREIGGAAKHGGGCCRPSNRAHGRTLRPTVIGLVRDWLDGSGFRLPGLLDGGWSMFGLSIGS